MQSGSRMAPKLLVADIGGTNVRFALSDGGSLIHPTSMKVADFPDIFEAIRAFLRSKSDSPRLLGLSLGVAGPVDNARSLITNSGWLIDAKELRDVFRCEVHLFNDFEALAWSLP